MVEFGSFPMEKLEVGMEVWSSGKKISGTLEVVEGDGSGKYSKVCVKFGKDLEVYRYGKWDELYVNNPGG